MPEWLLWHGFVVNQMLDCLSPSRSGSKILFAEVVVDGVERLLGGV